MVNKFAMGTHPDGVRAVCTGCERVVLKDTKEEAEEVVEDHNEGFHDGEDVADICAWDTLDDPVYLDIDEKYWVNEMFILAAQRDEKGMMDPDADHHEMAEDPHYKEAEDPQGA